MTTVAQEDIPYNMRQYPKTTDYHWPQFFEDATGITGEWTNGEGVGTGPIGFGFSVKLTQESVRLQFGTSLRGVQSGYIGCNTGNGEKLSNSQACCLAQLCLAAA